MKLNIRHAAVLVALALLGAWSKPIAAAAEKRPLRVLLLAGGPTREFQFARRFFSQEAAQKRIELAVLLQGAAADDVAEGLPERLLKELPALPAACDVVIAFDADWLHLKPQQRMTLEEWVRRDGGGLVLIPGPIHTFQLAQPGNQEALQSIRHLFPVELLDLRVLPLDERSRRYPRQLRFVGETPPAFVKLDDKAKEPLAGWDEFFSAGQRTRFKDGNPQRIAALIRDLDSDDFQRREKAFNDLRAIGLPALPALEKILRDKPSLEVTRRVEKLLAYIQLLDVGRGFYDHYPVAKVKPVATLVAKLADLELQPEQGEQPYLVTMNHGSGRVVYLGSGEMWRLRPYREAFYERFWRELTRWAAANRP